MKKVIKIIIVILFIVSMSVVGIKTLYQNNKNNIKVIDKKLCGNIEYKGLKGSVDFVNDEKNNKYIAYKNKIQYISVRGESYILLNDDALDITSLEYLNGNLYYASGTKIYCFNIKNRKQKEIINKLPNFGDYKNSYIKINQNYLFVTIGSATNSGVVGIDNEWLKINPYSYDITPKTLTLKGKNFGNEKTGAFVPYNTKNIRGQIVNEHFPGNSSILVYNLTNGKYETFAWGIRNVTGLDFNKKGKLIANVGGMEDRGLRPVKGDYDYIYEINKGKWYGFPDYTGGDQITSFRFKGENNKKIEFILDKHPTINPPAPIYIHSKVSAIRSIAVDKNNLFNNNDEIYFFDKIDYVIYALNRAGACEEKIVFNSKPDIKSIKFINDKLLILDSKSGILYSVQNLTKNKSTNNKASIYIILILILGIILILIKLLIDSFTKKRSSQE